jgi:HAE1 family hydrophobic/amphiphilic exporter-1
MVPFSSFASGRWTSGAPRLARFNGVPSINIWGEPAPGKSSGEAMRAMEEAVEKLPKGFGFDWTGLSYQERTSSSKAPLLYAFSVFVIFLCLAAIYESWTIPIAILLVLPLGVIGGIIASGLLGLAMMSISRLPLDHPWSGDQEPILIVQSPGPVWKGVWG